MIMAYVRCSTNMVKERRLARGWSQAELARRAGISRAAVSAIEMNRLAPSVAAALSLAASLECSVEELFAPLRLREAVPPRWAWTPSSGDGRFWHARVGRQTFLYPVETTLAGLVEHDGICLDGVPRTHSRYAPDQTLVLACCDPAAGLLAAELHRRTGLRLLALSRSSDQALALLGQGLVHAAGVHLATPRSPQNNVRAVREQLGKGFSLLRVARWQEGLALSARTAARSIRDALRSRLRWVGRQPGSGARQCQDELLGRRPAPRRMAKDHRSVAEAIRAGWADAGVCLRLVGEEAGLRFLSIREEMYDLCFADENEADPRIQALIETVRSAAYPRLLAELPGYSTAECGELQAVP